MAGNTDSKFKRMNLETDEAPSSGGLFLRVKDGGNARFYLVDSGAISYQKTEPDFNDRTKSVTRTKFLFLVLDMSDCKNTEEWKEGVGASVKLLECGPQVYNAIHNNVKEYQGDFKSALKLERKKVGSKTEYSVIVVPKTEGDFTPGQQVVIESFLETADVTLANALEHFAEKYSNESGSEEEEFDPTKA
jgi:hypothetical protein